MSRLLIAVTTLVVIVAACSQGQVPSARPSSPAAPSPVTTDPSAAPASPAPHDESPATASPATASPATSSPSPSTQAVEPSEAEAYLLNGVRSDIVGCVPDRTDLPANATAAIECTSADPAVARVGLYLFAAQQGMLDAYFERMNAEDVPLNTIACDDSVGAGEAPYTGGDGDVPSRNGCFINSDGYANYRATLPGWFVYVGVLGRSKDMGALADFAWKDNQDTPGNPTVWRPPVE